MDRLGLDWPTLSEGDPKLVYCSITGFGAGAGAALPGYDLLVQALGGLMSITGEADTEPQKAGVALVDVITGLFAAVGVLAAVRYRDRTGEGQRVEVDLLSSLLAAWSTKARPTRWPAPSPAGWATRTHRSRPSELFPTADGDLALAVGNDKQFAALCKTIGTPVPARDERFSTNGARVAHRGCCATRWSRAWRAAMRPPGSPRYRRSACPPGRSTTSPAPSRWPRHSGSIRSSSSPHRRQPRAAEPQPDHLERDEAGDLPVRATAAGKPDSRRHDGDAPLQWTSTTTR